MLQPPKGERPHIVIVGHVNSGKSTLFNQMLRQSLSITSEIPGTTTDAISKAMELPGYGAIQLIDTPGFSDPSPLGTQRMASTRKAMLEADILIAILHYPQTLPEEVQTLSTQTPIIPIATHANIEPQVAHEWIKEVEKTCGRTPLQVDDLCHLELSRLFQEISESLSHLRNEQTLTGKLAKGGDLVVLVMPQDASAPQGRIILPQVQVLRELLDKGCITICIQPEQFTQTLSQLATPPNLIITDSQAFATIYQQKPKQTPLTSFSVLMSAYKGNLHQLLEGAKAIDLLTGDSKILIAEACTHAPESEDIGTVKIPRLLRHKFGESIAIEHVSGKDFPADLTPYDLIIHCGACMFNRSLMLHRQTDACAQNIPMTNYGLAIAQLSGILPHIALPY